MSLIGNISRAVTIAMVVVVSISCNTGDAEKSKESSPVKPNVVVIYLDDLGYGDLSCYGSTAISTPNIDKLAAGGIRFTDGHASSSTCTPSRYAILTGEYPWRKNARILSGSAPLLIDVNQNTLPKMMKRNGYDTGVVGKWHLGLGSGNQNWNESVTPGPNEVGFDYSYIMAATQDRVPTVYIDNGEVANLDPTDPIEIDYKHKFEGEPNAIDNPELVDMKWHHGHNNAIINGIGRIGFMKGGKSAIWKDTEMADHFLAKAKGFVKEHKETPFFLYYALQQPHVPRTPALRFVGKSGMGPRGDVILEADWCIGEFMKTLEEEGVLGNTLIIFSSDNGPVLNDGYYDNAEELVGDHSPSGGLRGGKYSMFEAGTRVPFITYWRGTIKPGVSDALVCQMDLMTSLEKFLGSDPIKSDRSISDGVYVMDALLGKSSVGRSSLILEANSKTVFRRGDWLVIPSYNGVAYNSKVKIEIGSSKEIQLYNLKSDIGQQENVASENSELVEELMKEFKSVRGEYSKTETLKLR